jgi:protein TonB
MFEQSMMNGQRVRPWTLSLSTLMQAALIGGALLAPLLRVEALPPVKLPPCLCMPPPKGVQLIDARPVRGRQAVRGGALIASARPTARRPITVPTSIPQGIPQIFDDAGPAVDLGGDGPTGKFGAPWGSDQPAAILMDPVKVAPPPAPQPKAAPAVAPKPPIRRVYIGGVVRPPRLIHEVKPPYPPLARQARISGVVKLEAVIAVNGTVQSLRLISGHPLLTRAALDAVSQWRYQPTLLNGDPVEIGISIEVNFTLTQ